MLATGGGGAAAVPTPESDAGPAVAVEAV